MKSMLARDEREAGVDRAADRLAYLVVTYGLLVIAAYRSFALGQSSWDLLALVLVGAATGAAYRLSQGVLTRQALVVIGLSVAVAIVVAAAMALGLRG